MYNGSELKSFIENEYLVLLDALESCSLDQVKKWFSDLALKNTRWQDLESKLFIVSKEKFSHSILCETIIAANKEIFIYLETEQGMHPIESFSLMSLAIFHQKEELIEHIAQSLTDAELLESAKFAEKLQREKCFKQLLLIYHNRSPRGEFSLEYFERELFNIKLKDTVGKPFDYLETADFLLQEKASLLEENIAAVAKLPTLISSCQYNRLTEIATEIYKVSTKIIDYSQKYHSHTSYFLVAISMLLTESQQLFSELLEQNQNHELFNLILDISMRFADLSLMRVKDEVIQKQRVALLSENEVKIELYLTQCEQLSEYIKEGNLAALKLFFQNWHQQGITCIALDKEFRRLMPQSDSLSTRLLTQVLRFWREDIFEFLKNEARITITHKDRELMIKALSAHQEKPFLYFYNKLIFNHANELKPLLMNSILRNLSETVIQTIKNRLVLEFKMEESAINQIESQGYRIAKQMRIMKNTMNNRKIEALINMKEMIDLFKGEIEQNNAYLSCRDAVECFVQLITKMIHMTNQKINNGFKLSHFSLREYFQFRILPYSIVNKLDLIALNFPDAASTFMFQDMRQVFQKMITDCEVILDMLPENTAQLYTEILREGNEDSIDALNSEEIGLYHEIKLRYGNQFEKLGIKAILADLKTYLEAKIQEAGLSLEFSSDFTEAELKDYYSNMYHTAWRYLFCHPNPWKSQAPEDRNAEAIVGSEDTTMLAYFWLAASDASVSCTNQMTLQKRKDHFVQEFSFFGRAHNLRLTDVNNKKSPLIDDSEGDKPSCPLGIPKRNCQLLFGHPILDEIKPLSSSVMLTRFREALIAYNATGNSLFDKLNEYSVEQLKSTKEAIIEWSIELNNLPLNTKLKLKALGLDSRDFIKDCIDLYSEERLKCEFIFQNRQIKSYISFIKMLAKNPYVYYSDIILEKIEQLLKQKQGFWSKLLDNVNSFANRILQSIPWQLPNIAAQRESFVNQLWAHLVPPVESSFEQAEEVAQPSLYFAQDKTNDPVFAMSRNEAEKEPSRLMSKP